MGLEITTAIEEEKPLLIEATREAFRGIVPQATDNFNQITGATKTEMTARRVSGLVTDENKRIIFTENFANWYFSASFTSYSKGLLIEHSVKKLFELRRRFALPRFVMRDFWDIERDLADTLSEMRYAKVKGDFASFAMAVVRLETLTKELTRSANVKAVN